MAGGAPINIALTIAGSDPSGGAGIQADLKTFSALRVYGMAVIAALTAQNTSGVSAVEGVAPEFVASQLEAVLSDIPPGAVKTGMLLTANVVETIASLIRQYRVPNLVVDPVMLASSRAELMRPDARETFKKMLLPQAHLITPNLDEAGALTNSTVDDIGGMERAAARIHEMGARHVLVKGGHLRGDEAIDVFFDGTDYTHLRSPRSNNRNTHGTGCVLSAAIAAYLARGLALSQAVAAGKDFVTAAIACGLDIGKGVGACDPLSLRRSDGIPS